MWIVEPHLLTWGVRVSQSDLKQGFKGKDLTWEVQSRQSKPGQGREGAGKVCVIKAATPHPVPGAQSCCGALGDSVEDVPQAQGRVGEALLRSHTPVG